MPAELRSAEPRELERAISVAARPRPGRHQLVSKLSRHRLELAVQQALDVSASAIGVIHAWEDTPAGTVG